LALEAWEILLLAAIILLLLKPDIILRVARSLGKIAGEHKKGKSTEAT